MKIILFAAFLATPDIDFSDKMPALKESSGKHCDDVKEGEKLEKCNLNIKFFSY